MFTIKVRDSVALGGNEALYSANTIEVILPTSRSAACGSHEAKTNWDQAGIYLDAEVVPETPDAVEHRTAKQIILFGGEHTENAERRKGGKVWVMNEHGATVATYDL